MKKNLIILTIAAILISGCTTKNANNQGVEYGIIQNPSVEITEGSVVRGWSFDENEKNIDLGLLNAACTPHNSILKIISNNPNIIFVNRLDSKSNLVIPINKLCCGTIFQSEFCKNIYIIILISK